MARWSGYLLHPATNRPSSERAGDYAQRVSISRWAEADAALGVPLSIADDGAGGVVSFAGQAMVRRDGLSADAAHSRVAAVLAQVFSTTEVDVAGDRAQVTLAGARVWQEQLTLEKRVIATFADGVRAANPRVRLDGVVQTWDTVAEHVGLDAALWAVLSSASRGAPYNVSTSAVVLASRADANPLALLRRAHAALVLRMRVAEPVARPASICTPEQSRLLSALALVDRAVFDSERVQRSRPVSEAVFRCAAAVVAYLETTPVTRTDLLLSEAARRVLADALAGARIAAPVPY